MKECFKKISAFFHRYINGTKGAVSLLLALLMTPMLSISLILVQSARYQSVVEAMEEIADLCGFSTIGNYDSYLQKRFGFFALSQGQSTDAVFNQYMNENLQALSKSVTLDSGTQASGVYPLSNDSLLRQQIVEQSEISVITKTIYEGLDIDKMFEELQKMLKLDGITKSVEAVNAGAEVAKTIADLVDGAAKVITANKEYKNALKAYQDAYEKTDKDTAEVTGFTVDAQAYILALQTAEANLTEEDDPDDVYKDKGVKDAASDLKASAKTYYQAADTLSSKLKDLRDATTGFQSSLNSLPDEITTLNAKKSEAAGNETFADTTTDWVIAIAGEVVSRVGSVVGAEFVDEVKTDRDALSNQITALKNLEKADCKTIQSSWTDTEIEDNYGQYTIISIKKDFGSAMQAVYNALDRKVEKEPANLGYLLEVVNKLLNIQGVYNSSLNAVVSESAIYAVPGQQTPVQGITDDLLMASIQTLCNAIETFRNVQEKDGVLAKVWECIKAMAEVLVAIGGFLTSVITFALELVASIGFLVADLINPGEFYNELLMYGWAAYNMPNRVTCTSEKSLTGYSYSEVFLTNGGSMQDYSSGLNGGLFGEAMSNAAGKDLAFKGAVQEYLMVGSYSEQQNQSVAFFKLFMFRLVLNLPQIFTNGELNAMCAGPHGIIVKILALLAEPMLDTVFLVNGESEPLIKRTLYITPSGIDDLCKKLAGITVGKGLQTLISNEMKQSVEKTKTSGSTDSNGTGSTDSNGTGNTGTGNTGTGNTGTGNSGSVNLDKDNSGSVNLDKDSNDKDSNDKDNDNKEDEKKPGNKKKEGFLQANYGDHLFLMSFLMCDDVEYLDRIQNIIHMEAVQYYKKNGSYDFHLDKTNTFIKIELTYEVKPIFTFDVLPNGGVYSVDTVRFVGY